LRKRSPCSVREKGKEGGPFVQGGIRFKEKVGGDFSKPGKTKRLEDKRGETARGKFTGHSAVAKGRKNLP